MLSLALIKNLTLKKFMQQDSTTNRRFTLKCSRWLFAFILTIYFVCIINMPFWLQTMRLTNNLTNFTAGFALSIPLLLLCVFIIFFSCLSIRPIAKPCCIVITLVSAIISYAMYNYGVLFDTSMIVNILQSNYHEVNTYINLSACSWFFLLGILPAVAIYKVNIIEQTLATRLQQTTFTILIASCCIAIIAALYYKDYASIKRNNTSINKMIIPLHFIYSSCKYLNNHCLVAQPAYQQLGLTAKDTASIHTGKNNLLVLVVGETARSMNYQLNGYARETNKHTQQSKLLSFKNVLSCGTNTAVSIPCMFSAKTREQQTGIAANQDNLLDILQHAGLNVLWIDNNAGCYQTCNNIQTIHLPTTASQWCDGHYCVDEALVATLAAQLPSLLEMWHGMSQPTAPSPLGSG